MFKNLQNSFLKKRLKDPSYGYLFDEYVGDEVVVFDCETTGLNPKKDDIISIGALKIRGNQVLTNEKFERFVKPKGGVNAESIKIHLIRECDLDEAKEIDTVIEEFIEFVGNRPLVGYYLEFDVAMINKYLKPKLGIKLPNLQTEVSSIYHNKKIGFIPQGIVDLRFDSIMKDLDLPIMGKHDAINDAIMTALIYIKLQNTHKLSS
jgi:DNA polymerase-3 subunit epsilon